MVFRSKSSTKPTEPLLLKILSGALGKLSSYTHKSSSARSSPLLYLHPPTESLMQVRQPTVLPATLDDVIPWRLWLVRLSSRKQRDTPQTQPLISLPPNSRPVTRSNSNPSSSPADCCEESHLQFFAAISSISLNFLPLALIIPRTAALSARSQKKNQPSRVTALLEGCVTTAAGCSVSCRGLLWLNVLNWLVSGRSASRPMHA